MRNKADMVKMFPTDMGMEELFGLREPAIIKVLESVSRCAFTWQYAYGGESSLKMSMFA